MDKIDSINNEIFGKSKAIHSPNDETIKQNLKMAYGSFIESTNENDKTRWSGYIIFLLNIPNYNDPHNRYKSWM